MPKIHSRHAGAALVAAARAAAQLGHRAGRDYTAVAIHWAADRRSFDLASAELLTGDGRRLPLHLTAPADDSSPFAANAHQRLGAAAALAAELARMPRKFHRATILIPLL